MKSKICLAIMLIALFAFSLAVSVSAEDISVPDFTEVITYDEIAYKDGFDTTSRVLLSNGDGTYSTYPSNYIIKGNDDKFSVSKELDFTALKNASGIEYSYASVIRFEMPVGYKTVEDRAFKNDKGFTALQSVKVCEGVTTMGIYIFYESKTIVEIELPSTLETIGTEFAYSATALRKINIPKSLVGIPKQAFRGCTNLTTVDFSEAESLETIGYWAFYQCSSLESALLPEGVTLIDQLAFKLSGVKSVYLPSTLETIKSEAFSNCSSLENIECHSKILGENMFTDCTSVKSVDLSSVVTIGLKAFYTTANKTPSQLEEVIFSDKLTSIGDYAFIRAAIKSLEIPASLTTVGSGVFQENYQLEKVVFLGSVMGGNMFHSCKNLSELVLTTSFEKYGSSALNDVSTTFTTYYTGSDHARIKSLCAVSRIKDAKYSTYEDYKAGTHTQGNYIFIYGANLCEVAYGEHTMSAPTYHFISYTDKATVSVDCLKCGIGTISEEIAPIFVCLGYSASVVENGGIAIGYTINHQSVAKYEKYTNNDFSFGVFIALENKIGSNDIFDQNGKMEECVIGADLSKHEYVAFVLKIVGFTTDIQKEAKLVMGAFVGSTNENGTEYTYLQNGTPDENEKYYSISYNDILNEVKK